MIKMPSNPKRCGFTPRKARKATWNYTKRQQRIANTPGVSLLKENESALPWQADIIRLGRYTFERVSYSHVYFKPNCLGFMHNNVVVYMIDAKDGSLRVQIEQNSHILAQFESADWDEMMGELFVVVALIL